MSYAGKTIGNYEIGELIGAGGMGEVYRATDTSLGREVAVKFLPASVAKDANRLARFEQEARSAGALNHPNIVTIFELGTHDRAPYIVMELVDGQSLRKLLGDTAGVGNRTSGNAGSDGSPSGSSAGSGTGSESGAGGAPGSGDAAAGNTSFTTPPSGTIAIPLRKAIEYGAQMARGLAAAHDKNIVHRDLKPDNVLVTRDGRAKILDFGLAKLTAADAAGENSATMAIQGAETTPGAIMGTVGYMSPEQVRGEEVDHRADLFALGVILYEMLSGRRAFLADTTVQTMNAILTEDPSTLATASGSGSGAGIPHFLDRIVRRCLEKNPAERFQSGHDLAYALEAAIDASVSMPGGMPGEHLAGSGEHLAGSGAGFAGPVTKRSPGVPIVATIVLAGLAAAAGWFVGARGGTGSADSGANDDDWSQARFIPLTFEDGVEL
ncbi:MAG: serine/threonine protein kinase, partial [Gemmatimonadetes bacterium]|nr:serine/threonine protein kinase [Gemmatimonadota bacterium]